MTLDAREHVDAAPESLDLITSVFALHAVNDLPGVLIQVRRALKPDGLFLAALFGGDTLTELRQSLAAARSKSGRRQSARRAVRRCARSGRAPAARRLRLPVADVERTIVRYGDVLSLIRDLRAMGETMRWPNAAESRCGATCWRRRSTTMRGTLPIRTAKLRATFDIVYLTAGRRMRASSSR